MTTRSGATYRAVIAKNSMSEAEELRETPATEGNISISASTMLEMLREQQKAMLQQQESQQRMMFELMEQQKAEFAKYREEVSSACARTDSRGTRAEPKLPKPTLQKLDPSDDIEHYIASFERIAQQQKWPEDVWATQLAGLLTGKAMAAYASMDQEEAESYAKVKRAILQRYEVNEETHRQRFRQDRRRKDETYREWSNRLREHFSRWSKDRDIPLEELVLLEQFMGGLPEGLAVWLREKKPNFLQEAAEMADDYVTARKAEGRGVTQGDPLPNRAKAYCEFGCENPTLNCP